MNKQKDNSGALFINDRRQKDTHPNYTGKALIGGQEYLVSGWVKSFTKDGQTKKFISLSYHVPQQIRNGEGYQQPRPQQQYQPPKGGQNQGGFVDDGDLPF